MVKSIYRTNHSLKPLRSYEKVYFYLKIRYIIFSKNKENIASHLPWKKCNLLKLNTYIN